MMDKKEFSFLPLLALLLSAAVIGFSTCGTPEVGSVSEASMTLHATATTLRVGQTVTVSIALVNGETSNVRLGQPQYMLYAHPDVFSLGGMEPVERPVTLEPGQSNDIEFVLQATAPGRTMLMGTVGYEMHDLEYSWASWSGCNAEPLEITITP